MTLLDFVVCVSEQLRDEEEPGEIAEGRRREFMYMRRGIIKSDEWLAILTCDYSGISPLSPPAIATTERAS